MISTNRYVGILYGIFKLAFWVLLLLLVLRLCVDIFASEGRIGPLIISHHSDGIRLPIKVSMVIPDSTVRIKGGREKRYYKRNYFDDSDSLFLVADSLKHIKSNKITIEPFPFMNADDEKSFLHMTQSRIESEGYAQAKFSNKIFNWVYTLFIYIKMILLILIFYLLKEFFFALLMSFSFSQVNISRVKNIGSLMIIYTLFSLVINYSLVLFNGYISIDSFDNGVLMPTGFDININPRLDFKWTVFMLGLSLHVLSSLLKLGYELKEDSELSI